MVSNGFELQRGLPKEETEKTLTVEEAKQKEKFDTKTTIQDIFENKVVVPEEFK